VATTLLVAGSTLTFWIPPFASTSLYSRIFVGLSWELHCWWQSDHALERWRTMGRQKGS